MKTLELKNLRDKKTSLENTLFSLNNEINLIKIKGTSQIREYLSSKFDNIVEILMSNSSLIIQTNRSRFSHEINISNDFNFSYGGHYAFNPKLSWTSATISMIDNNTIDYINVVSFIANEMKDIDNSEIFNMIKDLFYIVHTKSTEINKLSNELNVTTRQIDYILYQIKLEEFNSKLKDGNFYYHLSNNRWSGDSHHIVYISKINPKTVNVVFNNTRSVQNLKALMDNVSNPSRAVKRVRKTELFKVLEKYDLIDCNIDEFILNTKFKNGIKKIKKEKGESFVRDVKLLCKTLKEMNITTVNVPDNDTLTYISKWRHNVLEDK